MYDLHVAEIVIAHDGPTHTHTHTHLVHIIPFLGAVTPSSDPSVTEVTVNRIQCTYVNNVTVSH